MKNKKKQNLNKYLIREKVNYSRLMSVILLFTMVIGLFAMPTYANTQSQVESVSVENTYYIVGENPVTGEAMISPTMSVSWENPDDWATAADLADIHKPAYFNIGVDNLTTDEDKTIRVNSGSDAYENQYIEVHDDTNLETGSLYEITVLPYHYHDDLLISPTGTADKAYAITELQVDLESNEDSITVIWDDLGIEEFQYRIIYAIGDFSSRSKQDLINNKEGEITGITIDSDKVTSYYDSVSRRDKLSYTIENNIYPGQLYSIIVEPTVEYYQGVAVTRNRNYPVINSVSTDILLSYSEEVEKLRLQWDIPASFKVGSGDDETGYELVESTLLRYKDGQEENVVIFNNTLGAIGYYILNKPIEETEYQLELTYKAVDDTSKPVITATSNRLLYSPTTVMVEPTKPLIPELISEKIVDDLYKDLYNDLLEKVPDTLTIKEAEEEAEEQLKEILAKDYLVQDYLVDYLDENSGDNSFETVKSSINIEEIYEEDRTYHFNEDSSSINLAWSAFSRIDIDQTSDTYGDEITDLATYYDIWVTNSYNSIPTATKLISDLRFSSSDDSSLIKGDEDNIIGFHTLLESYYNADNGEMEALRANQIYYIKIVAKKKSGDTVISSDPSLATLYYTDDGDSFAPPLITKPPLRIEDEDTTSITLAWKEKWYEVIEVSSDTSDPLDEWSSQVWVTSSGDISGVPIENGTLVNVYESEDIAKNLIADFDAGGKYAASDRTLEYREIDLGDDDLGVSNVYYKFMKLEYTSVQNAMEASGNSFSEYFDELVKNDQSGEEEINWIKIQTSINPENSEELIYQESGLTPNTSYMFVLYPYRVLYNGDELNAHYPTPIVVVTKPEETEINPDPTVPKMYVDDYTDRTVTLRWQYNTDFEYELLYSTKDDSGTATAYEFELPTSTKDSDYPVDGEDYYVTIPDLFPDTGYYFFIRAKQSATNTTSLWSNPIFQVTRDIETPAPPSGVGIASITDMKDHDYDLPITEDYISISWLKNVEDTDDINEGKSVQVYYSYILEVANNKKFIGPQYIVSGDTDSEIPDNVELLEKNLAKINELISNRYYYFRMKTRVTIVGDGDDQLIVKESDYYSPTLKIITIASDDEYDSESDPALEILPSENFELIYDEDEQELTYRFRDDSIDADGNADNNVDQRLISDLISRNLYEYEVDIANFDNKPITSRKVQIPYSIIEAFDSQEIELKIDAGHMLINIPHDALLSEVNRQKDQYGVAPMLEFTIDDVDNYYDDSRMPKNALTSVSVPQEMSIKVKSSKVNKKLNYSDQPIEIGLSTTSRYAVYGKNPIVYALDSNQNWGKLEGKYDQTEGAYMLATKNIGSYGVFLMEGSHEIKSTISNHWSDVYKNKIDDQYTVEGLDGYNPNSYVKEDELINIVYNIVKEQEEINVSDYVSNEQLKALYYAGIKSDQTKGASSLNREEAISMVMRAIEIRDDLTIVADSNKISTVNSNSQIDSQYKELIAKAASVGLVSDLSTLRPNEKLTYAELFAIWSKAEDL